MPFDFSDDREFNENNGFENDVEQPNPESFRAMLQYVQDEALRAGYAFPGHLIGVAAEAMDCFVEDHRVAQAAGDA